MRDCVRECVGEGVRYCVRYCVREYVGEVEGGRQYDVEHTVCDELFSLATTVVTISCLVREIL